jgi:hypothetical protein
MGMQRIQQQIAFMNVVRGIPPQLLNGRRLDIGPILDNIAEATFGPTQTQNILIDERHKVSIPAETENHLLHNGAPLPVSPMDDDVEHIHSHEEAMQMTGDPNGYFRTHMKLHFEQLQKKQSAMAPTGQPGIPGGAAPGVAGTPRPGAMPAQPRPQGPPGSIHPDQMADAQAQPRG